VGDGFAGFDPDNAVNRLSSWLAAADCPATNTGAYSKARQRLPESVLQRLVPEIAESLEQQVPLASAMVRATGAVCDGTTVLMSDSSANQQSIRNIVINCPVVDSRLPNWS